MARRMLYGNQTGAGTERLMCLAVSQRKRNKCPIKVVL